jgi:2-phosphoglycerate kinase
MGSDRMVDDRLRNVYWIGGGSAAGKSTIARRIAARHDLSLYATDDAMAEHARASTPASAPLLHRFLAMDLDERWVRRSPETMLETFHWFHGECCDAIVADVARLARTRGVVVEGFRLLPSRVAPLLGGARRAVWLLPAPDFRRAVFEKRGPAWGFLPRTRDPAKALDNLLERDRLFTERLREETRRLALPAIEVDLATTEDELLDRVTAALGL